VKILILIPSISVRMGGSVTSAIALAKLLARDNEVEVWTTDHEVEHWDATLSDVCKVRGSWLVSERFFVAPGLLLRAAREMRRFDAINVFHFWTMTGVLGSLIAPFLQVPVFIHTQGMFLPVALRHHGLRKLLACSLGARYVMNRFTEAILCNPIEQLDLRQWGFNNPTHVLPNAVTPISADRGALRRKLGLSDHVRIVAYMNRFNPIKRVLDLCRAFRLVQDRCGDAVFLLAGDASTPYGRKVQAYAEGVGLRALFLGYLGPLEKWSLLADADVLCQYSAQEGQSNALTEAIAAGVPTVLSRGCNFESIGTEGAGIIVDSIEEMADAINRLLSDAGLRRQMSANALRLAQNYTPDSISAEYRRIVTASVPAIPATTAHVES
jgi:glycosyltransferase involved in cell wall biosynthesis